MTSRSEAVLSFWLGELDAGGHATEAASKRWFLKDPAFDAEIRDTFLADYEALVAGSTDGWLDSARGRLAAVIVLDQFSRNMFRDEAKMYAADSLAQRLALEIIDSNQDRALAPAERMFCYMPLMHAEDINLQSRCVQLFESLAREMQGDAKSAAERTARYAIMHREIVDEWGRFPHRNEILGRESSKEEVAFLQQPGSSF